MEYGRHHQIPAKALPQASNDTDFVARTEDILDGMVKVDAMATLAESAIIWRAQYIAWNIDLSKAEALLFRLIYEEGSQNPQAMDILARIYFRQKKYEKARDLWNQAFALQPGNPALKRAAKALERIASSPERAVRIHKTGIFLNCLLAILAVSLLVMLGVRGYDRLILPSDDDSSVIENLTGRFSENFGIVYNSITNDMEFVPSLSPADVSSDIHVPSQSNLDAEPAAAASDPETDEGAQNLYTREPTEGRTYIVGRGDSLWIIAERIYGDGAFWTLLAEANGIRHPSRLIIGQELIVPPGGEMPAEDN